MYQELQSESFQRFESLCFCKNKHKKRKETQSNSLQPVLRCCLSKYCTIYCFQFKVVLSFPQFDRHCPESYNENRIQQMLLVVHWECNTFETLNITVLAGVVLAPCYRSSERILYKIKVLFWKKLQWQFVERAPFKNEDCLQDQTNSVNKISILANNLTIGTRRIYEI